MPVDTHAKPEAFAQQVQDLLDATLPVAATADPETRRIRCLTVREHYAVHPGETTKADTDPAVQQR